MAYYESVDELIGKTPTVHLAHIEEAEGLSAMLFAKWEAKNPGGSAKDRIALSMLEDAEAKGLLSPGATVIEPTSGNTGIGLCVLAAARGYRAIIVMPDTMSRERQLLMKAYGAQVVLTPGAEGMAGSIRRAEELAREIPGSFIPGQFENPANAEAHYRHTGPELWEDLSGKIDFLVAGVGTGGTLTGVGRFLKEQDPAICICAVEPAGSAVLSGGEKGPHGLQGIGAGFVPAVLDTGLIDRILTVTEEEAYAAARLLARREGILAGVSGGAALAAALRLAKLPENRGKRIALVLPDTGERYLSCGLFED